MNKALKEKQYIKYKINFFFEPFSASEDRMNKQELINIYLLTRWVIDVLGFHTLKMIHIYVLLNINIGNCSAYISTSRGTRARSQRHD